VKDEHNAVCRPMCPVRQNPCLDKLISPSLLLQPNSRVYNGAGCECMDGDETAGNT
jgi:hypothetical protein